MATTLTTEKKKSHYADYIREDLARLGLIGKNYDPRHVEAYMRCEHSTLDGLDARRFRAEVLIAVGCIDFGGKHQAELCAKSFGL